MKHFLSILGLFLLSSMSALGATTNYSFSVTNHSGMDTCANFTSSNTDIQWGSENSYIPNGSTVTEELTANCQSGQNWTETPTIVFTFSNNHCVTNANSDSCAIQLLVSCANGIATFSPGSHSCTGGPTMSMTKSSNMDQYTINAAPQSPK